MHSILQSVSAVEDVDQVCGDYTKFVYRAFAMAGESGVFRNRTKFQISGVTDGDVNVIENIGDIDFAGCCKHSKVWSWEGAGCSSGDSDKSASDKSFSGIANISDIADMTDRANKAGKILVELKTPLRFKSQGTFNSEFSAGDFFNCIYRRMCTLCSFYGSKDDGGICDCQAEDVLDNINNIYIEEKNLKWEDSVHYSARQRASMKMGGFAGTIKLGGKFSINELKLLEFGRIFNVGKNTNFGLGQIDYWTK